MDGILPMREYILGADTERDEERKMRLVKLSATGTSLCECWWLERRYSQGWHGRVRPGREMELVKLIAAGAGLLRQGC